MNMITNCEGKDGEKDISTPPRKKLKQARLSFQKLSPGVEIVSPQNSKKRKIDEDSGDDIKVIKVVKTNSSSECLKDDSVTSHPSNINDVDKENIVEKTNGDIKEVNIGESKSEGGNTSLLPSEENVTNTSDALKSEVKVSEDEFESNDSALDEPVEEVQNKDFTLSDTDEVKKDDTTPNDTVDEVIDDNSSLDDSDDGSDNDTTLNDTVDGFNSSSSAIIDGTPHRESASSSFIETPEKGSITNGSITSSKGIIEKKKLTPKQILRRQEIAKRREERERRKKEKEVMKAKEKEVKKKNQLERQEKKRKEKEEKEEQKKKEREEKEKKKQAELELKSEEKRLKEEEKRLKEEEKRKKEEQKVLEKKKKDEKKIAEEEAKRKVAAAFVNFFVASKSESKTTEDQKCNTDEHFMPFQVKADMRLAPALRTNFDNCRAENFDKIIKEQTQSELYLSQLRSKAFVPGSSKRTWPLQEFRESTSQDDEDVIFVSEESKVEESLPTSNQPKAKLFLFCENRRPPFWGTWRKKSKLIKPTQPFAKDVNYFDYEVDSDDEWEEEEPGESLHGSDDEKESEDEYEVDNEFFVPHGYLSEEENDGEDDSMSPETMKAKLKLLEMEFEEEMKHKTERVKPRLFGCFWINENSNVDSRILGVLSSYRAVYQENPIIICEPPTPETNSPESEIVNVSSVSSSKRKKFLESCVPDLLRLVHGNINGRGFLVKEFLAFLKNNSQNSKGDMNVSENNESTPSRIASKLSITNKIKQMASWIACPEEGPFLNRMCWYVPKEIRSAYGLEELVIPNKTWNYILSPKRELELSNTIPSPCVPLDARQKSLPLITKFTKKMTQEELQKQLALTSNGSDNDIEIVDEINSGKPSLVSLRTSQDACVGSSNGCVLNQKNKPEGEPADANKGTGKSNEIRQSLLPFKAKASCETPVTRRKRVPILMSVPLGQKISSPSLKSVHADCEEEKGKEKVVEKEANTVCT